MSKSKFQVRLRFKTKEDYEKFCLQINRSDLMMKKMPKPISLAELRDSVNTNKTILEMFEYE